MMEHGDDLLMWIELGRDRLQVPCMNCGKPVRLGKPYCDIVCEAAA